MTNTHTLPSRFSAAKIPAPRARYVELPTDTREAFFQARLAPETSPAKTVKTNLAAIDSAVTAASSARDNVGYGPYSISDSCTYDCGFMEFEWSWGPDYTSWFNFNYDFQVYRALSDSFDTAFSPALSALNDLHGDATNQFNAAIDQIKSIDTAIRAAGGTATPEQEEELRSQFGNANALTNTANDFIDQAIENLARFIDNTTPTVNALPNRLSSITDSAKASVSTNRDQLISEAPCGQGTITSKFNGISNAMQVSTDTIAPSFTDVATATQTMLQSVTKLTGDLLTPQDYVSQILSNLSEAQTLPPADAVREVKLLSAKENWATLVDKANQIIATE